MNAALPPGKTSPKNKIYLGQSLSPREGSDSSCDLVAQRDAGAFHRPPIFAERQHEPHACWARDVRPRQRPPRPFPAPSSHRSMPLKELEAVSDHGQAEIKKLFESLRQSHEVQQREQEQLLMDFLSVHMMAGKSAENGTMLHIWEAKVPLDDLSAVKDHASDVPNLAKSHGLIPTASLFEADHRPSRIQDCEATTAEAEKPALDDDEDEHAQVKAHVKPTIRPSASQQEDHAMRVRPLGHSSEEIYEEGHSSVMLKMLKASGGGKYSRLILLIKKLIHFNRWLKEVRKEPRRHGRVADVVDGFLFECICFLVVIANGLFIVYNTNYQMQHLNTQIPESMRLIELIFLFYYWVELVCKIWVHRIFFFVARDAVLNLFDFGVVLFATAETLGSLIWQIPTERNPSYLRLVRLLKMARVLRVAKGLRFISEIRLVLDMLVLSLGSLFRCIILLFFILGVFGILFVQETRDYLSHLEDDQRAALSESYLTRFGTVQRASLSLFMALTGGEDWGQQMILFEAQGGMTPYVYIFFMSFFTIAFFNIVTGQFMQQTLKLAAPDMEETLFQKRKQDCADTARLTAMVRQADEDHDGYLSLSEFRALMNRSEFVNYFEYRGIDIKDTEMFFEMLLIGSGDDKVHIGNLVWACLRMKGVATSLDVQTMDFELRIMHRRQKRFMSRCEEKLDEISRRVGTPLGASAHTDVPKGCRLNLPTVPLEDTARQDSRVFSMDPLGSWAV